MFTLGDHIGAYRLREVIGSGNSGFVYLADPLSGTGTKVAMGSVRARGPHEEMLCSIY